MTTDNFWHGWEKVRRIGRGGYGEVYEIRRSIGSLTEKAALKLIKIPADPMEVEMLQRNNYSLASITKRFEQQRDQIVQEYRMMQQLRGNSNIVQCNDIQIDPNPDGVGWQIGIRMELLTPLDRYLGKNITQQQVVNVGVQICNALIACKKHNIIHRDIKADNILVDEDGNIKLGDFGIAKVSEFTSPGTSIGTPGFEAPEVYHHREYGSSADIYSLGLVLYWMLNERTKPFLPLPPQAPTALQEAEARERRYRGEPLPLPKNGSPELKQIVLKAAAYQPRDRYAGAQDMQAALLTLAGNSSSYQRNTASTGSAAYYGWETTQGRERTVGGNTTQKTQGEATEWSTGGNTDRTWGDATEWATSKQQSAPKTGPKTAPKATAPKNTTKAAAPEKKSPSAIRKKKPRKKPLVIAGLLTAAILCAGAAMKFLQERSYSDDRPIINGKVPGVEVTEIPGTDANTLLPMGSLDGTVDISDTFGIRLDRNAQMEGISAQIHYDSTAALYSPLNYLGQDSYNLSVIQASHLGNGLFTAQAAVNDVNGIGLIDFAGETLLKPEAAIIDWPGYLSEGRFLLVGYAEEKASLGGEWQVALDEGYRRYRGSDGEGTKYQGYTKVFDLVNKQFIPGLKLENFDWYQATNCGDYFVVSTTNGDGHSRTVTAYDAEGRAVFVKDQVSVVSETMVAVYGENGGIYDYSGNQLYANDKKYSYSLVEGSVFRYDEETEELFLMDLEGNVVMACDGYWMRVCDDWVICERDGLCCLMTLEGEEILPCVYSNITYHGSGYFSALRQTGKDGFGYTLVGENGVIAVDVKDTYDFVCVEDYQALILNNRSFNLQFSAEGYWKKLAPALIAYKDSASGLFCVYDLFTGEQLLPAEYKEIECINDRYLYAGKDNVYEIYEVQSTFIPE